MNQLIRNAYELLKDGEFEYAVCGGFAIELFLNKTIRSHSDIDISVFWNDRDKIILYMQSLGWSVYELCGGGMAHHITDISKQIKSKRNIFCMTSNCSIVSLTPTNEPDMYIVDFDHRGQDDLSFVEFLFNNSENGRFLYARNHAVSLPLSHAILSRNGIQYLAPEMVLLYKSTDTEREGYQLDYISAVSAMTNEQKMWLYDALAVMNPKGHKWRGIWYHGSPLELTELAAGSTITQWRELAEAFSHKPQMLSYDIVGGTINHNGQLNGFLYVIDELLVEGIDIYMHPRTTMDNGVEWLTKRPLRLRKLCRNGEDIELKQLSVDNGIAEYNMLQEIDANEYGFTNEVNGMTYDEYRAWLIQEDNYSKTQNLPDNWIPQTTYFLYVNGQPVGIARIRHYSSDLLESRGVGNFGYGIAKQYRGKGYGNVLFVETIKRCKMHGYAKVKSFVHVDNTASNRVFLKNGAQFAGVFNGIKNVYDTLIE